MKKPFIPGILALIVLLIGNDWSKVMPRKTEINLLQPAVIIGIDTSKDGARGARVTLLLSDSSSGESGGEGASGGESKGFFSTATKEEATIAGAVEKIARTSFKEIPAGSIDYFLIGEEAVKADLMFYTDLLSKDNELQLISKIYIVKDGTAEALLDVVSKEKSVDIFEIFGENSGVTGVSSGMTFVEYLKKVSKDVPFAVPVVRVIEGEDKQNLLPEGYMVIDGGQFKGYIQNDLARGYNLVTNRAAHSTIDFQTEEGDYAAAMLENSLTEIDFVFEGDKPSSITIRVHFNADLIDAGAVHNITDDSVIKGIEGKQSEIIYREVRGIVTLAQEMKSDFLGLSEQMRLKHPYRWAEIEEQWPEILAEIPINVFVSSRLQRTYDMIELGS